MLSSIFESLIFEIKEGKYDFFDFPKKQEIDLIEKFSEEKSKLFDRIFLVGFGASSLNSRSLLCSVKRHKISYIDNLDRDFLKENLSVSNSDRIGFFFISKSGNTGENFLLAKSLIEEFKVPGKNLYIICPTGDNSLSRLAEEYSLTVMEHPKQSSGRFCVISFPSLLIASLGGASVPGIIAAASGYLEKLPSLKESLLYEAYFYLDNYSAGRNIYVTLNYSKKLEGLCLRNRQMYAESLGKQGYGATPLLSEGTLDEHSLLQLYLDGPDDKFYKIIAEEEKVGLLESGLKSHRKAVTEALKLRKRPLVTEIYSSVNEETVVENIMKNLILILLIARSRNIEPLNQPGVEECKKELKAGNSLYVSY